MCRKNSGTFLHSSDPMGFNEKCRYAIFKVITACVEEMPTISHMRNLKYPVLKNVFENTILVKKEFCYGKI